MLPQETLLALIQQDREREIAQLERVRMLCSEWSVVRHPRHAGRHPAGPLGHGLVTLATWLFAVASAGFVLPGR